MDGNPKTGFITLEYIRWMMTGGTTTYGNLLVIFFWRKMGMSGRKSASENHIFLGTLSDNAASVAVKRISLRFPSEFFEW